VLAVHAGLGLILLLRVSGLELTVRGLDAIDGTPILDIKPYATGFQPAGPVREPAWIRELMRDYY
jgi:tRNA (Thr-GGU) A37 N-methylase